MAQLREIVFNGEKMEICQAVSGRNKTSTKLVYLKSKISSVKKNVVIKPRISYHSCKNVSFKTLVPAYQAMGPAEKQEYFKNLAPKFKNYLAVRYCKDCGDALRKGEKISKQCRHSRVWPNTPVCVLQTLNKLANLARKRDHNRLHKTILPLENKFKNKCYKIYIKELQKSPQEKITFGDFNNFDEDLEGIELQDYCNFLKLKEIKKQKKLQQQKQAEEACLLALNCWTAPPPVKQTINPLRATIRLIVEQFVARRTGVDMTDRRIVMLKMRSLMCIPSAEFQMQNEETIAELSNPVEKHEGNVNIQLAEENAVPSIPKIDNLSLYTHVESNNEFESFTSRLTHLGDFTWSTNGIKTKFGDSPNIVENNDIELSIFGDIYDRLKNLNSPLIAPFKHFRFGKFDLEFVIKISSTILQAGTLLIAPTYFAEKLESTALLEPESSKNYPLVNPAILSQRPHALLKAHDVTEVTVKIPFKHWQTMMSLSSVSTSYGYWEYAKLNIVVLNKLMVAGSTCATGNLSGQIYVRLVNSQFSGMIPKASNQMMSTAALLLASRYLADPNNDLPGNYANPSRLQPSLSQSFSFGTNAIDNRDILRLDPTGNTPHPEQPEDFSELKIMQTPGLLNVVDWKQSDSEGKILFSVECTPLLEKNKYINFISDKQNNESAYVIPPVAVWASDKMAFTGGLVFTLDICTTKFSAGMLEVIYIPGEMPTNIADIDVSGYMHAVLDIKETKVYHIATPSIINQPAWYRRYLGLQLGENYVSPGQIVIRIRQALAGTCEIVPPDVKINIFVRADDNLRCHVLTAPVMVPQYYQTKGITYVATLNHPDAGIGTWAQATTTVEWAAYKGALFAPTLRYNAVTGGVNTAIVKSPLKEGLYSMSEQMTFHGRSGEFQTEFVLVVQTTYDDYWYIFPIPMPNLTLEDFVIIRAAFENNGKPTMSDVAYRLASLSFKKYNMSYLRTANDYDVIAYHKGILLAPVDLWNNIKPTLTTRQLLSSHSSFDNLLDAHLQNDIVRMVPAVPPSNASIFGEKPVNIKDACRRKQFLKLIDLHGTQTSLIADEFLPVCVNYLNSEVGLKSQIKCNNYNLYGSGYLGFRGSLVYTIIPLRRANGLLGVQHVPDIKNITDKHRNAVNTGLVPPDVLLQPGYAQQWVDMNLNSNLTIEIPYYRNSRWLFAPKTKNLIDIESIAQCNGGLKIFSTASETVTCAVWVAFGDDASFTYFQGFPPMKFLSDDLTQVTPIKVTNQILDKMQNAVNSHLDDVTANITPVLNNVNVVTSDIQAVVEPLKTGVPEIISESKEAVNGVRRVTDKIEKALDFVPTAVTDFLEKSREKAVEIFDILCNFAHVLVDLKNWKHWAIFLSSILIRWGVTAKDKMLQLIEALTTLIKSKFSKNETATSSKIDEPQPSTSTSSSNPSNDDCVEIPKATFQSGVDWLAVGALIVSGIGARSEVKSKNWYAGNISKLALITKSTAVGFKWVKELFQCIYEFVEASIVSLMLSMCPHKSILKADELQKYMVFEWYEVAIKYINPYYFDQIKNSKVYVAEVNKLIAYGQQLVAMLNILNIDPKVNVIVNSTVTSLSKIREKLRAEYIYGPAMEPFCVWVEGPAGVGKTYVQEHFFVNLLHSQSIELYGREMVFTVPAKAEFWERVENQPICVYDDFLVYKDDQTSRDVFATFLALVNKAPFSPPIAACEEKKKLYNPDVVWVNANWATSECAALSDKAAFHRRRHVVLRAKLHPDFADLSKLIQHDSYFSKYKTHVFTRYAEIPPEAYMGMVQLIYGSKVEANGSYNVPPSPHLLFDVLTCRGESDYDIVASDLDSLQTAKLLNMKFSEHRKNMFALLERSSNIASNLSNMQGEQIVFKAKTDDNGVATNSNIIMENLGKLCLTEVQVVGNAETNIQNNIMKHALPVSKSGLPLFKGCDLTDKKNMRSAAEFMTQARTANKTDYITLKRDDEEDPTIINIRDKLIKSYFQMDAPSTSKKTETEFKWFIALERAPNSLQDELYVINKKTKKKAQIKAYNHVMKFSGYDDIHYNQIASIFSEFKVLNLTYETEGKLEDILYKRWKTIKSKLEVIFKYHMKLHDIDMEREKEIDPYVAQLLQAMDEDNEDISDVLDLMELIQRNKLPEFYRSQLSTCCHHRFFNDKAYYVNGYFIMKLKSNIVVLSDKACINQVRCPWHNKTVYGNMMVNWSIKNIQVTEKVMSSNLTPEDLMTVPEYFKQIYIRNKKNFDIMQEAKKSWTGKIKKFLMKDVPDFLYKIYKFVKEYYPIVIAFICAFSLTTSAIYVAKTTEGQGEFFELVNDIGKKYNLMTPKQKLEYDVYRQQCQTGEVMENPSLCRTYISLLKRLDKNIDSSNSLQIINSGSQPSIRSRITNRHSSLLKQSKNQNLNLPAIEGIKNKIVRNTFWIIACDKTLPLNETAGMEMRCLGLAERWAVMPTHYLQWWEDADHQQLELRIFYKDVFMKLPNDWVIVKDIPQSGLVLFEVPRGIPHWQNILKYLPYDIDDFDKLNMSSVTLLETKINDVVIERSSAAQITMVSASGTTQSQVDVVVQAAFEYTIHTQPGTCGSVLMCGEKIVGMHIAGHMKPRPTGYSSALIGNEIYDILNWPRKKKIFEYHDLEGDEALGDWKDSKMLPNAGIIPLGVIKRKDLTIFIPNKSQWQQSLMFGVFPSRKSPAVLSYTDPRIQGAFSPLQEAINKHGLVPKPLPYQSFHIARMYWINKHINIMQPIFRQPSVLSLEQAICGIPGLNYYDKIEFNSSEGWPFSKIRPPGCSGKKWLFKTEVVEGNLKLKSIFPLLKEQINNHLLDTKENILSFSVVVDLLKDELKPNEKVLKPGKTRCFSGAPVDEVIRFKMFFQDYIAYYMHFRFQNSSAIGMSCVGTEPTILVNYMLSKNFSKHCCGDYTDFGPAFEANCGSVFYESAIRWYEFYSKSAKLEEEQIARKCMSEGFINPKHLVLDSVYQTICGMSSGCPATAPCNTDVNKMYIAIAWLEITKCDLLTFEENVKLVCYGDDIWFSISDEFAEIFNNETLHHFFKQYDIKYTDNTKSETINKYSTFEEVEFLKRKFIPHPTRKGQYLAALDKVSVEECCNWIQSDPSDLELTKQICESAMELAYSHGPDYYNMVQTKIMHRWSTIIGAPPLKTRSWIELDKIFYKEMKGVVHTFDSDWYLPEGTTE